MRRRFRVAAGVVVLAAGVAVWLWRADQPIQQTAQWVTVQRMDFDIGVETVGVLDAARAFHVASGLRGDRGKILSIVEDGARVAAGDELVRFDPTPFETEIQRLQGDLGSRSAAAEFAAKGVDMERSQAERAYEQAEFERKKAQQEYQPYLAYIRDLEQLRQDGHAVDSEILQAKRKAEQAFTSLQKAEAELERMEKDNAIRIARAIAERNRVDNEVASIRAALEQAGMELDKTTLTAPAAGIVVLHEVFQNNQSRKPRAGDSVWQGQPLLYLPDISNMIVKARVREEDLRRVETGQKASVRVEAFPDRSFEGVVDRVGVLAMDSGREPSAGKHFQLIVNLSGHDERLRPGMTARVGIVSEQLRQVVAVPLAAVFHAAGQPVCRVETATGIVERPVRVGRSNPDWVEILAGLRPGERVSLLR